MYLTYFGLNETPFAITPDPRFVYLSPLHEDALAHLEYGIGQQGSGGFVQLTGEVGTGKTTLCRLLLERLPDDTQVALILNPLLEPVELLESICEELALDIEGAVGSIRRLSDRLNRHLLDAHAAGKRVVVIIDEAQNLSPQALEQIRLLTNLETATRKLLQIILLGQPELRQLLGRADLRQLAQRITARYHLMPLSAAETGQYVAHRLGVAGASRNPFTEGAVRALHSASDGVPRLINIIAERALLAAYSRDLQVITPRVVRDAAREINPQIHVSRPPHRSLPWPRGLTAVALLATLAATVLAFDRWRAVPGPTPDTQRPVAPAAAAVPPAGLATVAQVDVVETSDNDPPAQFAASNLSDAWILLLQARDLEDAPLPVGGCAWRVSVTTRCLARRGDVEDLRRLQRPVLAVLADGYTVAGPVIGGRIRLHDGVNEIALGEFEDRWSGEFWDVFGLPGYIDRVVAEGDRGPDVLWVKQRASQSDPAYEGDTDDPYFGPSLRRWAERFQQAWELEADGLIGPQTLQYLSQSADHVDHS